MRILSQKATYEAMSKGDSEQKLNLKKIFIWPLSDAYKQYKGGYVTLLKFGDSHFIEFFKKYSQTPIAPFLNVASGNAIKWTKVWNTDLFVKED